ncbi:CUB-like domain-containing protein [Caenorhabditis elegans]|uniref:CUB-like domain-containing protein n=1 Tax=Caenorhabditis elegans TaxID=6239 RepID=Q9XUD5_CAEEL|nr:CUB-like domain-containing protein [Caenorhabditis elegans]CAB05221.1 CUB-like domain-containing protein [Caenorhabditis elegans]|eukprot:NP_502480.1 Uncharacterized protein CELE_F55G11.7 [Caenorhabditis elegans]
MLQKLLVCLSAIATVSAAGNGCKLGKVINKPVIEGTPVYWPPSWTETKPAPQLEKEQSCSWIVTIPRGYYAKLIISGKTTDKDSRFETVDAAGNLVQTSQENMEPYYFPGPKFTLAVSNEGSDTFAFKVVWFTLPIMNDDAAIGANGLVMNVTSQVIAMQYYSIGDSLTLMAFPVNPKNYYSLRSTLVFDGHDCTSFNYISNLYQLYQTKEQWVSSQDEIIIVNLEASSSNDKLLIQASKYLTGTGEMVELHPQANSIYNGTVNGGTQMSSLVAVTDLSMQMIDVQMESDATVTVYYGSPDASTLNKSYTRTQLKNALPLSFRGPFVQFVVSSGKAVFTFKS